MDPRAYDDFEKLTCTTKITDIKNGYYAFDQTVFYGEKGGQLSDKGTINGLPVTDLKWEHGTLYHKVAGELHDPIEMHVDKRTRWINTTVQSVFHLLDRFYGDRGLKQLEVNADPQNEWYIINSKDVSQQDLRDVEQWMNDVIRQDVKTTFTYVKGSDYPDPHYQKYPEVRLVHLGNIDVQPCGTCHVNHTGQIQSFAVLGTKKVAGGTKIFITVNQVTNDRLEAEHHRLKQVAEKLSVSEGHVMDGLDQMLSQNRRLKKQLKKLHAQALQQQCQQIMANRQVINEVTIDNPGDISTLAKKLVDKTEHPLLLWAPFKNRTFFAILSPKQKAREILNRFQQAGTIRGGGSPEMVTGNTELSARQLIDLYNQK